MAFELDVRSEDVVLRWLDSIAPTINRYMKDGFKRGGKLLVETAQRLTEQEDAIGATRDYYEGWRFEPEDARADNALAFFYNDADHAYFAEHGRTPGKPMPPETDEFLKWMDSKGIDRKASYVIRRAIGERGTIKKKGGGKGYEIMQRTIDMVGDDFMEEMEYAFERGVRALQ